MHARELDSFFDDKRKVNSNYCENFYIGTPSDSGATAGSNHNNNSSSPTGDRSLPKNFSFLQAMNRNDNQNFGGTRSDMSTGKLKNF